MFNPDAHSSVFVQAEPTQVVHGTGRYPIPLTLLARLAVDQTEQGAGLGKALLKDAMKRFLVAHEQVASRALLVHAADAAASDFYLTFGFQAAPFNPLHRYLLPKYMQRALRMAQG